MNGENRRSREAVRNSVRTYGVKVMDPASLPLKKTRERESQESMARYSEKSIHSHYQMREGCCRAILNRIPYATLVATILCLLGLAIFSTGRQRGAVVTSAMINDVLHESTDRLTTFDVVFLVIEITTAVIAIMIFIIGILATGDTRARVYGSLEARVGGRLCCAVLMILTILLFLAWLLLFWLFGILVFVVLVLKIDCDLWSEAVDGKHCLNLSLLNIFLSNRRADIKICNDIMAKKLCKDFVEKASAAYVTAEVANFFIIFSMVVFLICLAANYARIRCQAKFQELEELRHLEGDLHNSKDRF